MTVQPTLRCRAAWLDSVSLSGASKTLGIGYLCSQMAQGFSAAKAKVVFEGHCGFGDFRDQWDAGMAGTAGRERDVCLCPCCLMGFLAISTCPSASSLRHGYLCATNRPWLSGLSEGVTSLGCKMEMEEQRSADQKVPPSLSPLLSITYFQLRSDSPPCLPLPILL